MAIITKEAGRAHTQSSFQKKPRQTEDEQSKIIKDTFKIQNVEAKTAR